MNLTLSLLVEIWDVWGFVLIVVDECVFPLDDDVDWWFLLNLK